MALLRLLRPFGTAQDSVFTVELDHEGPTGVASRVMYVQSALLYTTSYGERRIRVNTMAIPVSQKACLWI